MVLAAAALLPAVWFAAAVPRSLPAASVPVSQRLAEPVAMLPLPQAWASGPAPLPASQRMPEQAQPDAAVWVQRALWHAAAQRVLASMLRWMPVPLTLLWPLMASLVQAPRPRPAAQMPLPVRAAREPPP